MRIGDGPAAVFGDEIRNHATASSETFEKCSILCQIKKGENFNRRNTFSISRMKQGHSRIGLFGPGFFSRCKPMKHRTIIITIVLLGVLLFADTRAQGRTVTDQLGRTVTPPEYPERIVTLAPNIAEIVFSLGQGERIIGVSLFSDFPEAVKKIPKIGSYVNLDMEKIIALKPDLCIATKDGNPREEVLTLASMDIPIYVVNPCDLTSVMHTITEIGTLLNTEGRAAALVKHMRERVARVDALVGQTGYRPKVFFQIGVAPIVSVGSNTYIHELIIRAGGANVAEGPVAYPRYSREQVLALAPEVIIITSMERGRVFEKVRKDWARWTQLSAVKNDRIALVDSNILDRPSPRLVDGLELLLTIIHPELFEN